MTKIYTYIILLLLLLIGNPLVYAQSQGNILTIPAANRLYLRLDGSNETTGEIYFGGDLHSATKNGCFIPSVATLNGTPYTYNGHDYNGHPLKGTLNCSDPNCDKVIYASSPDMEDTAVICCDSTSSNVMVLFDNGGSYTTPYDLDVCLFTASTIDNGGLYFGSYPRFATIIKAGECATALTAWNILGANAVLDTTLSDVYTWDTDTCSYTYNSPSGATEWTSNCGSDCASSSFPETPTFTENSTPIYNWEIDDSEGDYKAIGDIDIDGNLSLDGNLTVGGTSTFNGDVYTDRWLGLTSNLFLGPGVIGAENITTGAQKTVALGSDALYNLVNGEGNVGIGQKSLYSCTAGVGNLAIGQESLYDTTTGSLNVGLGWMAGHANTTGGLQVYIGAGAGRFCNTGSLGNTGLGAVSLQYAQGNYNTAIGIWAGSNITGEGHNNIFIGKEAGAYLADTSVATDLSNCTFIGTSTKAYTDFISNSTIIGYDTTGHGSNTVTIGNDDITDTYLRGILHLNGAYAFPIIDGTDGQTLTTNGAGEVSWASSSTALDTVYARLDGTNTPTTGTWDFGGDILTDRWDTNKRNVFIGKEVAGGTGTKTGVYENVLIGYQAGYNMTHNSGFEAKNLVGIGYRSLYSNTTGRDNTGIGYEAGGRNTTGSYNFYLGAESGSSGLQTCSWNTAIGTKAMLTIGGDGGTAIGYLAMGQAYNGGYNTGIGYRAGADYWWDDRWGPGDHDIGAATEVSNITMIGAGAAPQYYTDTNETAIGYHAHGRGSNTVSLGNSDVTDTYVRGYLHVNDAYKLPNADGTVGQILATDGASTVSWASSSSALDTVYARLDGTNGPTQGEWTFEDYAKFDDELDPVGIGDDGQGFSILDGSGNEMASVSYYPSVTIMGGIPATGFIANTKEGGISVVQLRDSDGENPVQILVNEANSSSSLQFFNTVESPLSYLQFGNAGADKMIRQYLDDTNGWYCIYGYDDNDAGIPGIVFGAEDGENISDHGLSENDVVVNRDLEINGSSYFDNNVYGPESACTTPTTLTIDGAPGAYGGNDYDYDTMGVGCIDGGVAVVDDGITSAVGFCKGDPEKEIKDITGLTLGTDNIRACLFDLTSVFGPDGYATFLMPSSDSCANLLDSALGPGHGLTADVDDPEFLSWNPDTCEYDDRNRSETYTIVSTWDDPIETTDDSAMEYFWAVNSNGEAEFASITTNAVVVGTTGSDYAMPATRGLDYQTLTTNGDDTTAWEYPAYNPTMFYVGVNPGFVTDDVGIGAYNTTQDNNTTPFFSGRFDATATHTVSARTIPMSGIFGSAKYEGDQELQSSILGLNFYTEYAGSYDSVNGSASGIIVNMVQSGSGDIGLITGVTPVMSHTGTGNVATVRYFSFDETSSPQGALAYQTGLYVNTLENADVNIGIEISASAITDNNDWGITSEMPMLAKDGIAWWFGTERDVALSASIADQLDFTPSTTDGDVAINVIGTGGLTIGDNLSLGASTHLVLPNDNDSVTPTLAFGDGDTGIYESLDDVLIFVVEELPVLSLTSSGTLISGRTVTSTLAGDVALNMIGIYENSTTSVSDAYIGAFPSLFGDILYFIGGPNVATSLNGGYQFSIEDGTGNAKFSIHKDGYVGINNGGPTVGLHIGTNTTTHSLSGTTAILITGDTEIDGTTYLDNLVYIANETKIGDGGTTNYTKLATDGEITLFGTARVYKNEWITVGALKAPGVKPAAYTDYGISGAYAFDDSDAEVVVANIRLPQDMDKTVVPDINIGWGANATSGNVVWQVEYLYRADNEALDSGTPDDTLTVTSGVSGTSDGLVVSSVTLAAPGSSDKLLLLRIKRLGTDGSDDLSGDAYLVGCGLKYTADKLGQAY